MNSPTPQVPQQAPQQAPQKPGRLLMGMLTPSSNTILEPVTMQLLSDYGTASAHFSRFTVTEISTQKTALGQFDTAPMLAAADLLADAKVGVICWNGTSASWLGVDQDIGLCRSIQSGTGIPATSAVLAMVDAFRMADVKRVGLVTPYVDDIQEMIIDNFSSLGFTCVAEAHSGMTDNFAFSTISETEIETMVRRVADAKPDAITILCTNLNGARIAVDLEQELGIPIFDSIALSVWGSLRALNADTRRLHRWGSLFRDDGRIGTLTHA